MYREHNQMNCECGAVIVTRNHDKSTVHLKWLHSLEVCSICTEHRVAFIRCEECNNKHCFECSSKVEKCPFCRTRFGPFFSTIDGKSFIRDSFVTLLPPLQNSDVLCEIDNLGGLLAMFVTYNARPQYDEESQ